MGDEIIPRYEFRTFERDLADTAGRIRQQGVFSGVKKSSEIYLVTETNVPHSVKIRGDRLEMKSLLDTHGPLELWKPRLKLRLPLSARNLENQVFAALAVDPPEFEVETLIDERMLVEQILPSSSEISPVRVRKKRFLFVIELCRVEYGELLIEDRSLQTVAIEHEAAEKVLQLREMLGLVAADNTSYMKHLEQVVDQPRFSVR